MYKTIFENINERIILNNVPSFTTSLEESNNFFQEIESENEVDLFSNGIIEPFIKFPPINNLDESLNIPISTNNESKEKKFIFKIKKNPGRKPKFLEKKKTDKHTKYSEDNIRIKIIGHYYNFILNFINEILHNLGFKQQFLDIEHKFKINITKKSFSELKTSFIGDILCQKVSSKFRKNSKDNLKIFNEVTQNNTIKKILEENYLKLFENIYYKNKKIINLINYGLNTNIILSNKVKTFKDLLKKKNVNNDAAYKKELNQVVLKYFLPNLIFLCE